MYCKPGKVRPLVEKACTDEGELERVAQALDEHGVHNGTACVSKRSRSMLAYCPVVLDEGYGKHDGRGISSPIPGPLPPAAATTPS